MVVLGSAFRGVVLAAAAAAVLVAIGRAQTAPKERQVRFGDVVLSGFETAEIKLGTYGRATGPNTSIDASDPKEHSKATIRAHTMTAFMAAKDPLARPGAVSPKNEVDRIEVDKDVRFSASRTAPNAVGLQTVEATGTKGRYFRRRQLLELDGPVTFRGEQPSPDGKGKETLTGSAGKASYDQAKQLLVMSGDVSGTVVTPDLPAEGQQFSADEVTVDMSVRPYEVKLSNPSLRGKVRLKLPQPEANDRSSKTP